MIIDEHAIETAAGTYTVEIHQDSDAQPPENDGFGLVFRGRPDRMDTTGSAEVPELVARALEVHSDGTDAWDREYRSGAAIVRYMRLLGHQGVTLIDPDFFPETALTERHRRVWGLAWAPNDEVPLPNPDRYTQVSLYEWQAWAAGDTFGWKLLGPDGSFIDARWGYYGLLEQRGDALGEARAEAEGDAEERVKRANLVGAGIVGVI